MANIGVSEPYYAVYTYDKTQGTYSYGTRTKLGKATQVDISIDSKDPTVLYADNGPAESITLFGGGTATLGIDELSFDVARDVLGLTITSHGTDQDTIRGLNFLADAAAPYVGLAFIVKKVYENEIKWRVVVLYKCKFKLPDYSISTQGETVEFQTPSLEAQILRNDETPSKWSKWAEFDTESDALAYIKTGGAFTDD